MASYKKHFFLPGAPKDIKGRGTCERIPTGPVTVEVMVLVGIVGEHDTFPADKLLNCYLCRLALCAASPLLWRIVSKWVNLAHFQIC